VIVMPVVNETTESTSAFEELSGSVEETEPLEENKVNAVAAPMDFAMKFMGRYDLYVSNVNPTSLPEVLVPMEILVEVSVTGGTTSYKVLASQNDSFSTGDILSFKPVVNPETLIISTIEDEVQMLNLSGEMPNFKFPESLKNGDKVAFFCEVDNCSDKKFAWTLVF
jgi:hypothetical protein